MILLPYLSSIELTYLSISMIAFYLDYDCVGGKSSETSKKFTNKPSTIVKITANLHFVELELLFCHSYFVYSNSCVIENKSTTCMIKYKKSKKQRRCNATERSSTLISIP